MSIVLVLFSYLAVRYFMISVIPTLFACSDCVQHMVLHRAFEALSLPVLCDYLLVLIRAVRWIQT